MRRPARLIPLFLFGSGLSALVYQTAWERMLRLVFGASTAASSAVLAIFLGGLGVGGAVLGRRAERSARPLELYGNLEVGVAVTAALTPVTVELVSRVYYALGGRDALGSVGATAVRLVLAALVLGPSVVLMGGTLPAAARAAESDEDVARDKVALLYAANTAGAVAGALLGTFLMFELFGTRLALWAATLVNLLVAVVARRYGRMLPVLSLAAAAASDEPDEPESRPSAPPTPVLVTRLVYAAAALVGFSFLGMEIVWYRMLGPMLGGSSFTFGLILAVALAGIGLGGYVYSRRRQELPATLAMLATTVALEAAFAALPLALGDDVALLAGMLRPLANIGFGALVLGWTAVAAIVVFPTALVSGYQFPVLVALLGRGRQNVAAQIGMTYAFNTAGSIVGALAVGFLLLPAIGLVATFRVLIAALLVLAFGIVVLELWRHRRFGPKRTLAAALTLLVALVWVRAPGPTAVSRHAPIGAGRVFLGKVDKNDLRQWMTVVRAGLLWEQDGVESSVGVMNALGIAFLVNGKSDGAVITDRGTQGLLGVLPSLLHPAPKRAFVLGLGTGMSAGWLSSVPGMERVDVAELEPAVLGVARECKLANQDVLTRPNVHVFVGDGREFLLKNERKYDLIVSEPSNPYRAGTASLFTTEFYQVVKNHMAQGGLFGQWVQGYEIDAQTLRIVLATLTSVFPHVEAWQTEGNDFLMLCRFDERAIDMADLRRRVREEPYRTVLPRAGLISDAEGVLARLVARAELVKNVAESLGTPTNTDDAMLLDYAFARRVGIAAKVSLPLELALSARARNLARPDVVGEVDWMRVDEERGRAWLVYDAQDPAPPKDPVVRAHALVVEAACVGRLRDGVKAYREHPFEPRDSIETFAVGKALALDRDPRALDLAGALESAGYAAEGHLVRARYLLARAEREPATAELISAVRALRTTALPLCQTAREVIELLPVTTLGRPELAADAARVLNEGPLAVYIEDSRRIIVAQRLAFRSHDAALCVAALGKQLTQPWWDETFLEARAACLERAGHPMAARAKQDLIDYLGNTAGRIEAGLELPPLPALPMEGPGSPGYGRDEGFAAEVQTEDAGAPEDANGIDDAGHD
jgi:spermidine synthase